MTVENCERLAAHCAKMNDKAGEQYYLERAAFKKKLLGIVEKEKPKKAE